MYMYVRATVNHWYVRGTRCYFKAAVNQHCSQQLGIYRNITINTHKVPPGLNDEPGIKTNFEQNFFNKIKDVF